MREIIAAIRATLQPKTCGRCFARVIPPGEHWRSIIAAVEYADALDKGGLAEEVCPHCDQVGACYPADVLADGVERAIS